ncbi:glycosyltransferase family 4 protein [Curtobacterium sp. MCBD17_035]|uniref:glycosyltransferase family 4 protein n=1 Tax=Curtobacterium sp. MCBD17_035 TaxID=2175673 RepID=UPI000DA9D0EA|nr:glycosyltransferase family 4 protein [Curtobacterium sp. MCBD17_035]WIB67969.1 glycosyltransferase family 4 protein [Curtobacterium sp. MCBD17_035]
MSARLRRGAHDLAQLVEIAPELELLRLVRRPAILRRLVPDLTSWSKARFDSAVAKNAESDAVVLGMPSACLELFGRSHGLRVFHQVDGHPAVRNQALLEHYGAAAAGEVVPARDVDRINREMDRADAVLTPSDVVAAGNVIQGVDPAKLIVEPYGVDLTSFRPAGPPTSRQRRSRRRLLFLGQISYRKGIPTLLAAAVGEDFELKLVGPVVEPHLLRDLPQNVTHTAALPAERLGALFDQVDALVLPSVEDAFGLVVPEALAAGLPVIASTAVGAASVIGAGQGTVVPAGDAQALRAAMQAVVVVSAEDRHRVSDLARAARSTRSWQDYSDSVIKRVDARIEGEQV